MILQINIEKSMTPEDYVSLGNQLGMDGDHVGASKIFKSSIKITTKCVGLTDLKLLPIKNYRYLKVIQVYRYCARQRALLC